MPNIGSLARFKRYTLDERRIIRREIRKVTKAIRQGGTVGLTGHHGTDRKL